MSHINTLKLHQLRLGELAPAEEGRLRAHLNGCDTCTARMRTQQALRQEFLKAPFPDALQPRAQGWRRWLIWLPAASLIPAALAVLFLLRVPPASTPPGAIPTPPPRPDSLPAEVVAAAPVGPQEAPFAPASPTAAVPPAAPAAPLVAPEVEAPEGGDIIRRKGASARLEAWVQSGASARPLYTGESLAAGERVQLRFDARGRGFVTLAGRDNNGLVEVYGTVAAGEMGLRAAPFSLTLDGSPGEQTFFALTTDERPDPEAVLAALRRNPVRMEGAHVASVVVRKN